MSIPQINLPTQCNAYPPAADNSNIGNMGSQLLDSMGGQQSCDLSSFYAAVGGKASAGPGGLFGNAEFSGQLNGLKKSGCQVMASIVGSFLNSVYQARCVIENDNSSTFDTVEINQNAYFNAIGPGSVINCPGGININQSANLTARVVNTISSTSANTIAGIAQAGLSNAAAQVGQVKDGYQGTGSGSKYLQAIQSKLIQASQSQSVKNAITNAVNNYKVNQNGIVNAISGGVVFSKCCNVSQDAIIDLQLANIISNAYTTDIKDSVSSFLSNKSSLETSNISDGAPDVVGGMFKNNWMYIVGAVVAVILGIFLLKFLKSKNASKMFDKAKSSSSLSKSGALKSLI